MIAHLGKFTKKHWIVYLKQGMWCVSYTSIKWLRSTIPGLLCFWEVLKVVYRWGLWWVQQHIGHSMSLSCFLKDTSRDQWFSKYGPKTAASTQFVRSATYWFIPHLLNQKLWEWTSICVLPSARGDSDDANGWETLHTIYMPGSLLSQE